MIGNTFITELAIKLRDTSNRQWLVPHNVEALNAALRALTKVIPRAHTVNEDLPLVPGYAQPLAADINEVIALLHLIDPETGDPGNAVILADLAMMDHDFPTWRTDTATSVPVNWFYEPEKHANIFYTWPPITDAVAGLLVHATVARTPTMSQYTQAEIDADSNLQVSEAGKVTIESAIPVQELYVEALYEWALYYSFMRDDEATSNYGRANGHFQKFFDLLGVKTQANMAIRQVRRAVE